MPLEKGGREENGKVVSSEKRSDSDGVDYKLDYQSRIARSIPGFSGFLLSLLAVSEE